VDTDIDLRQASKPGLIARALGILENAGGALVFALTMVMWTVMLDEGYLLLPFRKHALLLLIFFVGAFVVFEMEDERTRRIQASRGERDLKEHEVLKAADDCKGKLHYRRAARLCPHLSLDEASEFLLDLAFRGHCTPSESEVDTFLFSGVSDPLEPPTEPASVRGASASTQSRLETP